MSGTRTKAQPPSPQRPTRPENEFGSVVRSFFHAQRYIIWYQYVPRKMVPLKALFLDNSSRAPLSSKARAQGHAFIIGACAWRAPRVFFFFLKKKKQRTSIRGVNPQRTTVNHGQDKRTR